MFNVYVKASDHYPPDLEKCTVLVYTVHFGCVCHLAHLAREGLSSAALLRFFDWSDDNMRKLLDSTFLKKQKRECSDI